MNFIVLGTSEFTLCCARAIIDSNCRISAIISMPVQALPLNSADVAGFADEKGIPYHEIEDINAHTSVDMLRSYTPDYVFSSWPGILKKEALDVPQKFVIGSHPTDLPFNRGRHPLHWLIVMGITRTKISFFNMDEGIDSGNLLYQHPFTISHEDYIEDAAVRMNNAAYEGLKILCNKLSEEPFYAGAEQNHGFANYWRKRTPHDVTLDLRMSSSTLLRTVKSFAPPYPCANLVFEKDIIKISNAAVAETELKPEQLKRIEPGCIISVSENVIRVKVDDAIMDLTCKSPIPEKMYEKKYIHPPSKYFAEFPDILLEKINQL